MIKVTLASPHTFLHCIWYSPDFIKESVHKLSFQIRQQKIIHFKINQYCIMSKGLGVRRSGLKYQTLLATRHLATLMWLDSFHVSPWTLIWSNSLEGASFCKIRWDLWKGLSQRRNLYTATVRGCNRRGTRMGGRRPASIATLTFNQLCDGEEAMQVEQCCGIVVDLQRGKSALKSLLTVLLNNLLSFPSMSKFVKSKWWTFRGLCGNQMTWSL